VSETSSAVASMWVKPTTELGSAQASEARRIVIVRHLGDAFEQIPYVIHLLVDQWREWGLKVDILDHIDVPTGAGTVVIPHLDDTRTPRSYQKSFATCTVVLNRAVTDISKRRISGNLVAHPGDHHGPVIVKTDRNYRGLAELIRFHRKGLGARAMLKLVRQLPWPLTGMMDRYQIFDHATLVPRAVWHNSRLVVEKFVPEIKDGLYCLRQYTFFGNSEINTLALSGDPIVKSENVIRREVLSEPPPGMREIRSALGFDYGKFDYVLQDGQIVLYDVNRTPSYNPASGAGSAKVLIQSLAAGIHSYTQ
jgi:hypothetical protein